MSLFFIIMGLVLFSCAVFGITGGYVIYQSTFIRKPEGKGTLDTEKKGKRASLVSHISDPRIMDPLLAAKSRWKTHPLEEFTITSFDNLTLFGYYWTAPSSTQIAVLVHGFTDSAAGMAYLAEDYHSKNVSVLAVDCRAHGKSGGKKIGMGLSDAKDISRWIDFLKNRFGPKNEIILHGVSMGAATVLIYGGRFSSLPSVSLIISDSSFTSYKQEINHQLSFIIPGKFIQAFLRQLILSGGSLICRIKSGFFFSEIDPLKAVKNCTSPILFFHGTKDVLVPPEMGQTLFAAAREPKRLVLISGAPHIGSWFYDCDTYDKNIAEMIKKTDHLIER